MNHDRLRLVIFAALGDRSLRLSPLSTIRFVLAHPLNRERRLHAFARYLSWQVISRVKTEVEFEWIEGAKLVVQRGMTGATGNIYCGLHEYADMSFVLHLLRPDDLFVDIGANIGSYTMLASAVCGARSIAFEPDPTTVVRLQRNIAVNRLETLVEVHATALGEQAGEISFTIGRDTMNRVATSADQMVHSVPIARIDDLLCDRSPILAKLDVEGYETHVLRGAGNMLENPSLLAVLVETIDGEVLGLLERHGFIQVHFDPASRDLAEGTSRQSANVFFVRDFEKVRHRLATAPQRTWKGITV